MFRLKVYKYDSTQEANGYRGTGDNDFSKYVQQGNDLVEDITQILDTAEITLAGLPFQKEFDPKTKFIIDLVDEFDNILETSHFCVQVDMVNQPILSEEGYYDHHISFIEPSVVAQTRLVDNISTTYKLKDVTLKETPIIPSDISVFNIASSVFTPQEKFGVRGNIYTRRTFVIGKYFETEGSLEAMNRDGQSFQTIYNNIDSFETDVAGEYKARFKVPKLAIWYGVNDTNTFSKRGYASLDYQIKEFSLNDEYNPTRTWSGAFVSNSNLGTNLSESVIGGAPDILYGEWLLEASGYSNYNLLGEARVRKRYYKKYTDTTTTNPDYITQEIDILPNKRYVIVLSLHQFEDDLNLTYAEKYIGDQPSYYISETGVPQGFGVYSSFVTAYRQYFLTENKTSGRGLFITYDVDTGTIIFTSSTPYSALALIQKAIINSSIYEKEDGVYIADVNNSQLPFYIDETTYIDEGTGNSVNFIDELGSAVIIENFYNQKNLWEILVEAGNYIHAIPEIKFGSNDRFMITFNRLGQTNEKTDNANKVSIFNSRSVEDYISATSSYVTNMVQLGGIIEEWVVPKTSNEQLLVYNDTASIIVSKPIIELLSVIVRRNSDNATADMTQFIYEENVYNTLQIDYLVNPNRGIAMFYSLGDKEIKGGDYRLPTVNTGDPQNEYTFKKIIYCAFFGYSPNIDAWSSIKINDYSFFVRYKTKDDVRQWHTRPDLRKYLMGSSHDKFPEHNQFNNQTDVVVDSVKFGINMYGKLIKTGNSSYEKTEWVDNYLNVKHKGELYRINGELYYVATAKHHIFNSYILSELTFSKDYNELSKVVGIPSEPRFYEISEQSLIWRDVSINDLLLLTDNQSQLTYKSNYLLNSDHLADLIFAEQTDFAKYAVTTFKGDKDAGVYDQTVGSPTLYKEFINPINAYSSESTLTYEWDMADNYSAGDKVINTDKEDYKSLWATNYTDVYGRSALLDFYILDGIGAVTPNEIMSFPESPIKTKNNDETDTRPFIGDYNILATNVKEYDENFNGRGIGLLKDCREAISVNYNLELVTNSDTFVLSPYLFLPKKRILRIVLLATEVNKLSSGHINNSTIITPTDTQGNQMSPYFTFTATKTEVPDTWSTGQTVVSQFSLDLATIFENVAPEHFTGTDGYQQVKAIAVLCDVSLDIGLENEASINPYKTQFIIARNIPSEWEKDRALYSWFFGAPNGTLFNNRQ